MIPMRFNFDTVAPAPGVGAELEINPKQPSFPVYLISERSDSGVIVPEILGPDGKEIGVEGDGITGSPWDVFEFSLEALRSGVNYWPQNVGLINTNDGLTFGFDPASVGIFRGWVGGHVPGKKGNKLAYDMGFVAGGELNIRNLISQWQESGTCPEELKTVLEKAVRQERELLAAL